MDCQRARQLTDERLDATSGESVGTPQIGGPELDAHLAACPACAAEWREITRARELVADVANDAPTAREVDAMWATVQLGMSGVATAGGLTLASVGLSETPANPTRRWWLWRFVAASSAVAAMLAVALILGADRYGIRLDRMAFARFGEAYNLSVSLANMTSASRASLTYASDNEELRSVPALDAGYATNQQSTTREFWNLIRSGELQQKGFICPSSGDPIDIADLSQTIDPYFDFEKRSNLSYGYQGPAKVSGSPRADLVGAVAANSSPAPAESSETIELHGAVGFGNPGASQGTLDEDTRNKLAALGYMGAGTSEDGKPLEFALGMDNLQGTGTTDSFHASLDANEPNVPPLAAQSLDLILSGTPQTSQGGSAGSAPSQPARPGRALAEGNNVIFTDGSASFERTPIVGEDENNLYLSEVQNTVLGVRFFGFDPESPLGTAVTAAPEAGQDSPSAPSHPTAEPPRTSAVAPQPKIIKTGDLGLEVPSHDEAVAMVQTIARQGGGFVADASTQEQPGGALLGRIVLRVLPERFEELFAALKSVGRVEAENVKAADVTAEYVDLEARIKGLQITEERLQELIKNKSLMDKVSSLLEVEREVTRVRTDIEKLQGQLRVMADRIGLSTITVTLREPARTVPSASLSVEVPIVEDAAGVLGKSLESLGGRLLSGKTSKRNDGTLMGEYQFTVSLARFGELLAAIEGLGRVHERQVKDRQFSDASAPWADKVKCGLGLTLFERSRQLPSATVRVEVEGLEAAMKALDAPLAESSGAVVSNQTTRQNDGSSSADLKLRVPAGQFTRLLDALAPLGRTVSKQIGGEAGRIVGGAASVPCEIALTLAEKPRQVPSGSMAVEVAAFEPARNTLSTIIKEKGVQVLGSGSSQRTDGTWLGGFRLAVKAADMDALVARLESLGRVSSRQINGIGLGDLSRADPNALGVIELTLGEKSTIAPAPERAGDSIRQRLRDGLAGLYTSLGLIAYGLVVMAPWVLIVLGAGWLIMRRVKRGRNTSLAAPIAAPPALGKGA